ncbi:MAG: hypothetical protein AAGU14_04435 [Eubacteriaceae bacterium]
MNKISHDFIYNYIKKQEIDATLNEYINLLNNFIFSKTNYENITKSEEATIFENRNSYIIPDKEIYDEKALNNYKQLLINIMNNDIFEAGEIPESEIYFSTLINILGRNEALEILMSVYLDNFRNSHIILGILHIISHFKYEYMYPQGQIIALGSLQHHNISVKEFAIKAFENWGNKEAINILRGLSCDAKWLQEYVDEVIVELEKEVDDVLSC